MKIYDHGHDEVGRTKAQTMKWNTTHLIQTMHYYSEQNIVYQLQTTIITFNVLHMYLKLEIEINIILNILPLHITFKNMSTEITEIPMYGIQ